MSVPFTNEVGEKLWITISDFWFWCIWKNFRREQSVMHVILMLKSSNAICWANFVSFVPNVLQTMKQAEDRAHRVGQRDSVFVQYLLANGTADDILWPLVQKKLDILQSCNLSADTYRVRYGCLLPVHFILAWAVSILHEHIVFLYLAFVAVDWCQK